MSRKTDESSELVDSIIEGIFEKSGSNVIKMGMNKLENSVCDYFIITDAQSGTQVDSITESVIFKVKSATGEKPIHKEGLDNCFWVLLDYGNVIVHIFMEEYRRFYNLEGLWADAEIENIVDSKKN
jgi:ribosome-associated protein